MRVRLICAIKFYLLTYNDVQERRHRELLRSAGHGRQRRADARRDRIDPAGAAGLRRRDGTAHGRHVRQ